jgi:hypothetical protein
LVISFTIMGEDVRKHGLGKTGEGRS